VNSGSEFPASPMHTAPGEARSGAAWLTSLPVQQRRLGIAAVAAVIVAAIWLANRSRGSNSAIPVDSSMTPAAALANLHERGLTEAHLDAKGQLVVPPGRVAEAKAWLGELSDSTTTWADEWEKSNAQLGQFSGSRERDAAREITRARMIGRLLRQMPGIAQADVIWDEEESSGWRQPQRTRCTVYLRPKSGFEITPDVARSVRQAVAGSKKNLAPADIVVMDLDRMTSFDAVPAGVDEALRSAAERQVAEFRREIESALHDCPGVRVNVTAAWSNSLTGAAVISLSSNRTGGPNQRVALVNDAAAGPLPNGIRFEESEPPAFEPHFQVTVTAPEDAAERWAQQPVNQANDASDVGVVRTSWETRRVGGRRSLTSAAQAIRRSVASVFGRNGRSNIPASVAVHLLPTAKIARPSLKDLAAGSAIDPFWFASLALAGCLLGAWLLSSVFMRSNRRESAVVGAGASMNEVPSQADEWDTASVGAVVDDGASTRATVSQQMDDFEDLIHMPPGTWPLLWSVIPESVWTTALKGASQQLRRTVLANLDAEGRQSLQFAIEQTSPPRLTEIDDCQRQILDAAEAILASA
jgi:hypothetical protein